MNIRRLAARGFHAILRNNIAAAKILGVTFGKNCKFIGNPLELFGSEPWAIHIGDHVELTNGVQIITHDGALWVARSLDKTLEKADIIQKVTIGNNVFVGTNTTILGGVTIGDNVIIGAGSVVNKDIPSGFVAVGVPAKPIKTVEAYLADKRDSVLDTKGMSSRQKQQIWSKVF
ncbi:MAG: acyltransferase [Clostridia bacterium]|nr:acyltransferase [Clostridia bacterium]